MAGTICGGLGDELAGSDLQEALDLLKTSLATVATGDGPNFEIVKIASVKSQVVAGTLYHIKLQLSQDGVVKDYYVKLWTQPWLKENGTNIKIQVEGEDEIVDKTF